MKKIIVFSDDKKQVAVDISVGEGFEKMVSVQGNKIVIEAKEIDSSNFGESKSKSKKSKKEDEQENSEEKKSWL